MNLTRRNTIKNMLALPLTASGLSFQNYTARDIRYPSTKRRLKISLNAYSFNAPLTAGTMDILDMLAYCADLGFDGVDITGYYFKGYPNVPADDYLFGIKRLAHALNIEITGTGVRNDFTLPDKAKREAEVQRVLSWIEVAAKLGAPVLRIFGGQEKQAGFTRAQIMEWMVPEINRCVEYGKQHGVIIGLQNHNDFILTSDVVIEFMKTISSPWFGLILDTGSYRQEDPYLAIEKTIPYAVNWQIKENIFVQGKEVETDLPRLFAIIKKSTYQGYLPIETLGQGDPKPKIAALYEKVMKELK